MPQPLLQLITRDVSFENRSVRPHSFSDWVGMVADKFHVRRSRVLTILPGLWRAWSIENYDYTA